jgi:hypothetical protein
VNLLVVIFANPFLLNASFVARYGNTLKKGQFPYLLMNEAIGIA